MVMMSSTVNDFSRLRGVPCGSGIRSYEGFHAELERQQARAGLHNYRFSLLLFTMPSAQAGWNQTKKFSRTLIERIRSTDKAGWVGDDQLGVILPYTPVSGAARLAEDVQDLVGKNRTSVNYTVYAFPSRSSVRSGTVTIEFPLNDEAIHQVETATEASSAGLLWSPVSEAHSKPQSRSCEISMPDGVPQEQEHSLRRSPMPMWKRMMDILGSTLGLLVLSPLFLVVALVIKAVSKGPVFFKQERVGYQGRLFRLWKFRTYEVDADATRHRQYMSRLISGAQQGKDVSNSPMTKLDDAPGIIPFGNVIRKACIDELPQLINVFLGEMSLIGPRPPILYEAEQYADWHRKRLDAVPGMTGPWQVSGKNRLSFNEMVRLDIRYSRMKSLSLDILILLKTPLAIASQIAEALMARKPEAAAGREMVAAES